MNYSPIYITGLGTISAAGENLASSMSGLYSGRRNPHALQNIQTALDTAYPVFEVFSAKAVADDTTTRTSKLAMIAVEQALIQAGLQYPDLKKIRVGVALGTTVGSTLNNESFYRKFKSNQKPGLQGIQKYLTNNPALFVSEKLELNGPVATLANACSSGTDAIGLAKSWLEQDLCDIAIAGGADELSRITYLGFISLLISSTKACRPFDKERDGLNLGEGAGIIILEKEKTISRRKVEKMAQICGYATFADAYHPTAPHPEGLGLKRALNSALTQAGISASQVDFVNAHGTSTSNNDAVEGKVIAELFGQKVPVVSTKAYTGHTLGAAGGIEAVFTVQAILDQKLPTTAGFSLFDPECSIQPTTDNVKVDAEFAISNSLAFGGNNSTLVFRRAE